MHNRSRRVLTTLAAVALAVGLSACNSQPPPDEHAKAARGATPPEVDYLVRVATMRLDPPIPVVTTAPADVARTGEPVWFWDASGWEPGTTTAEHDGVRVAVTTTLDRVVWLTGDGATVTCTAPGTPRGSAALDANHWNWPSPDCGHTYTRASDGVNGKGFYLVTATVHRSAQWAASTGHTGSTDLPATTSTTSLRINDAPRPWRHTRIL